MRKFVCSRCKTEYDYSSFAVKPDGEGGIYMSCPKDGSPAYESVIVQKPEIEVKEEVVREEVVDLKSMTKLEAVEYGKTLGLDLNPKDKVGSIKKEIENHLKTSTV